MERLTKRCDDFIVMKSSLGHYVETFDASAYDVRLLMEKLAEYEDLEEQGKLLKLPCAVDSEVWYIDKYADLYTEIVRGVVDGYLWYRTCGFALNIVWDKPIMGHFGYKRKEMPFSEIGKTVFLTKPEAEQALQRMKEMEGKNDRKRN